MKKLKDENKILIMLAFSSIAKGLWDNFRQLWLQDNGLDVTQISQLLSIASLCCVIVLIMLSKKLSLGKIKNILSFSILIRGISLLALFILNNSGLTNVINAIIILDTIFEKVIIISIYPFIVTIRKDNKMYSKRKLVEYLFCDIGILIGGLFIGRTIGRIIVSYNTCLLISIIFLLLAFITIINIKKPVIEEKQITFKDTIKHLYKDKIIKLYLLDYIIANMAMNTGLGLKMLMVTNVFGFSDRNATSYFLVIGLLADLIGIVVLKCLTSKNDYINITIKFGIRFLLYILSFITNNLLVCFIAMTWSILISTAYENISDAPYINRVPNDYQMLFTNIRYILGLIGTSIGLYFAGITYNLGITYMLGLSGTIMIFQIGIAYYLIFLRRKEQLEREELIG